jgi:hypothetical protein
MKRLELREDKYLSGLVMMLWGLEKLEVQSRVLFLIEMIRESEGGYYVQEEKRGLIMERLRISRNNYELMQDRLVVSGDVRRENGILYLAPKWRAVKECEGEFLVSCKK